MHQFHNKYPHYFTYTREEFLPGNIIENIPIEEEEDIHPTRKAMTIYGLIQTNSVLAEPYLVAIIESYFSKSTGRTDTNILADKFND